MMTRQSIYLDTELTHVKEELVEMWVLVANQLMKTREAFIKLDKDLAKEVVINERRVNAYELKIDRDCENILALHTPVAVDLRCVLAVLKINYNLERIGDIAESIARFVVDAEQPFNKEILDKTRVLEMFDESIAMLNDVLEAFDKEDTAIARSVLKKDALLDAINKLSHTITEEHIKNYPDQISSSLHAFSIIRKLERVGDQSTNIAEEIIFFIEAKVLKHLTTADKRKN